MPTTENLQAAFAGESQANRKYLAFAKKAEAEGKPMVAKLFRTVADAETLHAHAHFKVMGGVQDTVKNLEAAVAGEAYEFQTMYPAFLKDAEAEKNADAVTNFKFALAVEKVHHDLYRQALAAVKEGRDLEARSIHLCPVCGNLAFGKPPARCPVCGVPMGRWVEVK
ncbi:MAG: rubrerythrin family protein [Planctomycetota bacterium]